MTRTEGLIERCRNLEHDSVAEDVAAILVGGSAGRGVADDLSDLDLFIYTECRNFDGFKTHSVRRLADALGDVVLFRGPILVDGFGFSFTVLYDDMLVCQLNVNNLESLARNAMRSQPGIMLFDRDGVFAKRLLEARACDLDRDDAFGSAWTFFWLRSLYTSMAMRRGDLWLAVKYLDEMRDQIFVMQRVLTEMDPPGATYRLSIKRIEVDLGTMVAESLAKTLPSYSAIGVADALINSMAWVMQECSQYAALNPADGSRLRAGKRVQERVLLVTRDVHGRQVR